MVSSEGACAAYYKLRALHFGRRTHSCLKKPCLKIRRSISRIGPVRFRCRTTPTIVMGHGGGGKLSSELVEHLFLPAFRNETLAGLGDAAVIQPPAGRLALSTDTLCRAAVVFSRRHDGDLAVNGTVNDLAVSGARPLYLHRGLCAGRRISHYRSCPHCAAHGRKRQSSGRADRNRATRKWWSADTATDATSTPRAWA